MISKTTPGAQWYVGKNGKNLKPMIRTQPAYKLPDCSGVEVQDRQYDQGSQGSAPQETPSQPWQAMALLPEHQMQRDGAC